MEGSRKGVTEKGEMIIEMGEETEGTTMGRIMMAMIVIEVEIGIMEKGSEMVGKEMIGTTVGGIMGITETGIIGMNRAIKTTDLIEEEVKETMVVAMKWAEMTTKIVTEETLPSRVIRTMAKIKTDCNMKNKCRLNSK
jgi:hypothetical protein